MVDMIMRKLLVKWILCGRRREQSVGRKVCDGSVDGRRPRERELVEISTHRWQPHETLKLSLCTDRPHSLSILTKSFLSTFTPNTAGRKIQIPVNYNNSCTNWNLLSGGVIQEFKMGTRKYIRPIKAKPSKTTPCLLFALYKEAWHDFANSIKLPKKSVDWPNRIKTLQSTFSVQILLVV